MITGLRPIFALSIALSVAIIRADPVLEETIEQKYIVEPTATLSIRNVDGSIRLYGADTNELKIQAIKKAYRTDRLKDISVNVAIKGNEISIDTRYPPKPKSPFADRSGTVDYIIVLPASCRVSSVELVNGEVLVEGMRGQSVHANLVNGRMYGHNCYADVHLKVTNGGLDVGYDWWETGHFSVHADIVNGNVRAFIPGESAFHLLATAPNGHVASEFPDRNRAGSGTRKIDIAVGEHPDAEIQIHAGNGSIHIAEIGP